MKQSIKRFLFLLLFFFRGFFTFKKKVILFSIPTHPNLGDQAQLMCTEKWIKENFKGYKFISITHLYVPFNREGFMSLLLNINLFQWVILRLIIRKNDIFIGHSGYFFIDHHGGWYSYDFLLQGWKNKFVILPQTVNFYTPVVKQRISRTFGNKDNLILLCRDEVSYKKAQEMLGTTKILLFPDIVTSLIGTRRYTHNRDGILFCMRNDIEAFYSPSDIDALMKRFGNTRMEKVDTTLNVPERKMRHNRDKLINDMIDKFATYKVVITDRYHGTIFSAIASTPVIVIHSADHKLSSGVNWFPKELFADNVQFADNLEDAYDKAQGLLKDNCRVYDNPPYFKEKYWDKLADQIGIVR